MRLTRQPHTFIFVTSIALILACETAVAQLSVVPPEQVGMRSLHLNRIDNLVQEGLDKKRMPGCVVAVGRKGRIAFLKAYGHRQVQPTKIPMSIDTVFDMASITKPMATATSIMVLVEQGKLRLRDKVTTYIPEFGKDETKDATVFHLLTHQAGFIPDNSIKDYKEGRAEAFKRIYSLRPYYPPTSRFVYSDVGFILLDDLIERQSGLPVDQFAKQNIFAPLGMRETTYLPSDELKKRAATTEQRESRWMQGEVHDPRAYLMGGVAGHAGLFSTAQDVAIYAQMMLNGGHYDGRRILSKATVKQMTSDYKIVEGGRVSLRGLGWDKLSGYSSNRAENMSSRAFGHGGFTGTVLWIDPENDLFFIFLSNRVHPNGKGSVNRLAGRIATIAVAAIDDELLSETMKADNAKANHPMSSQSPTTTQLNHETERHLSVSTGIDRLTAEGYRRLAGQRVGLITNQTGIDAHGVSTVTLLRDAPNVNLTAIFSPEHGLAGKLDQPMVGDAIDKATGLKIFSLYGKSRQPTPQQLEEVDTLVFDIQDIGCRFYTYISTMGLAMQAAASQEKKFVVLDRPNPIGGVAVGGPYLDPGAESFVAFHPMPVRHGMTVGELAMMLKAELKLKNLQLEIVTCEHWSRGQFFDGTGLRWVNPSPNMRNLNQAILYPGIGLWETTNLSVGRGTDTPFELVGAPWIQCQQLADHMNDAGLPGVSFTPREFIPDASKFAGKTCGGIQISITNRTTFDPNRLGTTLACQLFALYPDHWQIDASMRLLGNAATLSAIKAGKSADEILSFQQAETTNFQNRRRPFLLYKR